MMPIVHTSLLRYGGAVLAVASALLLTLLLGPWLEHNDFLLFFPALMLSAWYGGIGPGLLATFLSLLAIDFFVLPPIYGLNLSWEYIPRLGAFAFVALLTSWLTAARKQAEVALRAAHDDLEGRVKERTAELSRANAVLEEQIAERQRAEALKQSDALKSALIASVSHDLRTPLTSIRASVDSLLHNELNWDQATVHEFHVIISEEVNRLTRLVENLLAVARIEVGELHPTKQWGPVAEICNNVLDRCAGALRHHRVRVDYAEGLPLVRVDSRLVAQALANLVENASKYSPKGSEITVRAWLEGDQLLMSVVDHGRGIAPEDIDRVFDGFYRCRRRPEDQNDGTGMGLAIVRGIIEAHGGRIWVESDPGRGAAFTFALPVEVKERAGATI